MTNLSNFQTRMVDRLHEPENGWAAILGVPLGYGALRAMMQAARETAVAEGKQIAIITAPALFQFVVDEMEHMGLDKGVILTSPFYSMRTIREASETGDPYVVIDYKTSNGTATRQRTSDLLHTYTPAYYWWYPETGGITGKQAVAARVVRDTATRRKLSILDFSGARVS